MEFGKFEGQGDFGIVGRFVNGFALFAQDNVAVIEVAQVVGRLHAAEADVPVHRICGSEHDEVLVQRFEGAQVVRREQQLPLALFGNDPEDFAQQVFEDAGIELVYGDRDGTVVVDIDKQGEYGYDFLDAVGFHYERKFMTFLARSHLHDIA